MSHWELCRGSVAGVALGQSPTACDREETRVRNMGSALPAYSDWQTALGFVLLPLAHCLALLWPGRCYDGQIALSTEGGREAKAKMPNSSKKKNSLKSLGNQNIVVYISSSL